jgi:hypothetical protein
MDKIISNNRSFSYKQGTVSLSFSLNIDSKEDIKDFKKCLEEALIDLKPLTK